MLRRWLLPARGRTVFPILDVASLSDDPLRGVTPREREPLGASNRADAVARYPALRSKPQGSL